MHRFIFTFLLIFIGFFSSAQTTARSVDLAVFPNPTTEFISVTDATGTVATLEVYNLIGRKIKSFTFQPGEKYDVADLPKGLYLVRILNKQNTILSTQKVNKR